MIFELPGADFSDYQETIDWAQLAQSHAIAWCYAKATQGTDDVQTTYARNIMLARQYKIPCAAYHFFDFQADPEQQALFFLREASPQKGDLVPVIDVETLNGAADDVPKLVSDLSAWLTHVESAIGGKRCLIYTGWNFWDTVMGGSDAFAGHPVIVAAYNDGDTPPVPNGWTSVAGWQWDSYGSLAGVPTRCDLDRLYIPLAEVTI